jgi:hypothetical protein
VPDFRVMCLMRRSEKGELAGERELDGTGGHIFEKAVNRAQRFIVLLSAPQSAAIVSKPCERERKAARPK